MPSLRILALFPLLALATYENYRNGTFHRPTHFKV